MRYSKLTLAVVLGALGIHMAGATPTPEEAAQLGKSLTPFGAIKAGNKEGTIPEWTGGICTPPPDYKPHFGLEAGGGPFVNPYAADKPLYKITAADVAKYADKLDEGNKELLRRNPQTYYLLVYPTRRPACNPEWVDENTIKRVMRPKLIGGNDPAVTGAHAQIPFPIPKSGPEAMWNTLLKPEVSEPRDGKSAPNGTNEYSTVFVDASGRRSFIDQNFGKTANYYYDNTRTSIPDDKIYKAGLSKAAYPAVQVGTMTLRTEYLRADLKGFPSFSYIPGQRRVRQAPEFAYDGVVASTGGLMLYDEISAWSGKMDRFEFKLLGRKEVFIPYNAEEAPLMDLKANTPNHLDPAVVRWELHRVWVVEATLRPGERHVQKRKVFYIDEDSWRISMYNGFDQADKVYHANYFNITQHYEIPGIRNSSFVIYDLNKRIYAHFRSHGEAPTGEQLYGERRSAKPWPTQLFTPEGMASEGLR